MSATRWRAGPFAVPALALAGLVLAAVGVQAAITWSSTSTLTTSVAAPTVYFQEGVGAGKTRYFASFALSQNATSFTAEFKPRIGADTTVKDVVRITSASAASRSVTFTATQVANANVERFLFLVKDGSTVIATVDYLAASPSATFTLPAGATFKLDLRVDLTDAATVGNTNVAFDLRVSVVA